MDFLKKLFVWEKNLKLLQTTEHFSQYKKNRSNKSYDSHLKRWIDRYLPTNSQLNTCQVQKWALSITFLDTQIKKLKKVSAYDEFIVATLELISTSATSLEVNSIQSSAANCYTK